MLPISSDPSGNLAQAAIAIERQAIGRSGTGEGGPAPSVAGPGSPTSPLAGILKTLLPLDDLLPESLATVVQSVRLAVHHGTIAPDAAAQFETLLGRLALSPHELSGRGLRALLATMGLQDERSLARQVLEGDVPVVLAPSLKTWVLARLAEWGDGQEPAMSGPGHDAAKPPWLADAEKLLRLIERAQALNGFAQDAGTLLSLELPLLWSGLRSAHVYIEEQPQREGESGQGRRERSVRLVTLLDFDRLGPVRVDTWLTGVRLGLRIGAEREAVAAELRAALPRLRDMLTARGYAVEGLAAIVEEPSLLNGRELRARLAPAGPMVNCHV